jgi:protein-tyrosine-phosphatase
MSVRTRSALGALDLPATVHRSRQLTAGQVARADLVVAMAAEHVWYVRRQHAAAADRTATLRFLARRLAPGPEPLAVRVAALDLAHVHPDEQGDVADPAGGDDADYEACARQIDALVAELAPRLA